MDASYITIIMIAFTLALILVIMAVSYFVSQGRRKAWQDLSERIGAAYEPGNFWFGRPQVTGIYQQHHFKLDSFTRSTGKNSTTYTRLVVDLNSPSTLTLSIQQEGIFSKIGKALGVQEIQMGDDEVDQRFEIKGQPENEVKRVLSSLGMRQRLLEAPELHIHIKDQAIRHEKRGFETDPNTLIALLDVLCALANAIDRPQL
jgi:hypothetical protein